MGLLNAISACRLTLMFLYTLCLAKKKALKGIQHGYKYIYGKSRTSSEFDSHN